ncbi:MAG: asparagine synthase-related protein [Gammaproteobacteria bacterium]
MIPGVVLFARHPDGGTSATEGLDHLLATGYRGATCAQRASLGEWLHCGLLARPDGSFAQRHDDESVTVLLGGYVSASTRAGGGPPDNAAGDVARLYLDEGPAAFTRLRGSFAGVVVDRRSHEALVFTDRQGSHPVFTAGSLAEGLHLAPEAKPLARMRAARAAIDPLAVGEFLVRGCCYASSTLFADVRSLGQAAVFRIGTGGTREHRYWTPRFDGSSDASRTELLAELDALLEQATRRLLAVLPEPALLLSGGVDSRLMLAYLLRCGRRLPSYAYRVEPSAGEDHLIAQQLADHAGLAHQPFVIPIDGFASDAVTETLAADGRVQICDAPSNRWTHIGQRHRAMFIGDESFGWKGEPADLAGALDIVGWWNIDVSPRVCDVLRPSSLTAIRDGIARTLEATTAALRSTHPVGMKDELYYRERVANLLNGFSARRLAVCEQARPLLDEDVVDFFTRVPHALRLDKRLARDLLADRFPDLAALPYSRKTSVPWDEAVFLRLLAERPQIKDFIVGHLTDRLCEPLASMFDRTRLAALARCYLSGAKLPPYRDDWLSRVPGGWRFARERVDKVGTLRSLLRIMQLNIYLSSP